MKKKFLSMLLALSMTASIGCVNVFAEATTTSKIPTEINFTMSNVHGGNNQNTLGNALEISWKNPSYEISAIDVVDENGVSVVPSGTTLKTEADAVNYFRVTGLSEGTIYKYTVKITKADGNIETYTTTGKPRVFSKQRQTEEGYKTVWEYKNEGMPAQSSTYIDASEKANGNSSLKVVSNVADNNLHFKAENSNAIALETGAEYEFSFWSKTDLKGGKGVVYWLNDWTGTYYAFDSEEWVKNTYKLYDIAQGDDGKYSFKILDIAGVVQADQKGLSSLKFYPRIVVSGAGVAYIDDIELRKYNEDGTLGNNMYINYSFEYGSASDVNVVKSDASATISWKNPASANITEAVVVDETNTPVETASATSLSSGASNSVALTGLTNNTLYKYYIRLVINGVTEFIPVTFVPEASANPQINEDGYIMNGWYISSQHNTYWSAGTKREFYIDSDAHSGTGSFKIYSKGGGNNWGYIKRAVFNLDADKSYKLSVYTKAKTSGNDMHIRSGDDTYYIKNIATGANADTWTYFESGIIKPNGVGAIDIRVFGDDYNGTIWIDDMVLTPVDADGNAIGEPIVVDDFDYNSFSDVACIPSSTEASIRWTNPNNQNITEVYVTNAIGGRIAEDLEITAKAKNAVTVSGLTAGKPETFHIYAKLANGTKVKKTVNVVAGDNKPFHKFTPASYYDRITKDAVLSIDKEEKYSNNSSAKIHSYMTTADGQYGSINFDVPGTVAEKTYKVSFMFKSKNMSGNKAVTVREDKAKTGSVKCLETSTEWTKYEFTFTESKDAIIKIMLDKTSGEFWFDDLVVREYDAEKEICIGDNLIKNGGFEEDNIDEIKSFEITEADGKIKAEIKKYNSYTTDCYIAAYDANGKLIEVTKAEADTQGELMQTVTPEISAGENVATVKAFVWDGMTPVAMKIK